MLQQNLMFDFQVLHSFFGKKGMDLFMDLLLWMYLQPPFPKKNWLDLQNVQINIFHFINTSDMKETI